MENGVAAKAAAASGHVGGAARGATFALGQLIRGKNMWRRIRGFVWWPLPQLFMYYKYVR
jgi:hypothetical protein